MQEWLEQVKNDNSKIFFKSLILESHKKTLLRQKRLFTPQNAYKGDYIADEKPKIHQSLNIL